METTIRFLLGRFAAQITAPKHALRLHIHLISERPPLADGLSSDSRRRSDNEMVFQSRITIPMPNQLSSNILMVRPANFGFNPETAENNAFQFNDTRLSREKVRERAIEEFDTFVGKLQAVGIQVIVYQDLSNPVLTDAIFPNNWITCHEEGLIVTYPMFSPNRRGERREEIMDLLKERFAIKTHIKLENWEQNNQFLEGTGSMILDRPNKMVYACLSVRTNEELLDQFCYFMGYEKVLFDAVDKDGLAIYHTNVMMALGDNFVVICLDTIRDEQQKAVLKNTFTKTEKEIIDISLAQMEAFAGNMLQVKNRQGQTFLVMSSQAYGSLAATQIEQIERHTQILHSDLKVIETYGGGSARCMMAEVFLPAR